MAANWQYSKFEAVNMDNIKKLTYIDNIESYLTYSGELCELIKLMYSPETKEEKKLIGEQRNISILE